MSKSATRTSWQNSPIENPERTELKLHFSDTQFGKLTRGLIPREMEDKWFIFYEDTWLYFHRSWTGFGAFKTQLIKGEKGYLINEFWTEGNKEKYNAPEKNKNIQHFVFLIACALLHIDPEALYSNPNKHVEDDDPLTAWSNFGRLSISYERPELSDATRSLLFGVAVGDALGVPVEFDTREEIAVNPVKDMRGYGTYNMPPGTFSDDSSLTFCLAEVLCGEYDLQLLANKFVAWLKKGYWTATGRMFDVGGTTAQAIDRLETGTRPELAGSFEEGQNGNGSLMRILPLVLLTKDKPIHERYELTRQVSSLTHAHVRSVIGCFYHVEFARQIMLGLDKFEIYKNLQVELPPFLVSIGIVAHEIAVYDRLLLGNIHELPAKKIRSKGYVVDTLEASTWCLLTTENYPEAILKAVNLGEDTDTTAAVTGGLAGLLYGLDGIPAKWLERIAKREEIEDLAERLAERFGG